MITDGGSAKPLHAIAMRSTSEAASLAHAGARRATRLVERPRACAVARSRGSRGTWGALGPDMERGRRNHEGRGSLREKLGALIAVGSSVLSRMARRLGCPALAT